MKIAFGLILIGVLFGAGLLRAQDATPEKYVVKAGTRIPLVLVNTISTKNAREGDRVYLQTAFPIAVESRIVIPEGSYVTGTVTQVKRPGRVKGKGELYVRFDSLMLPNGVQRDFRGAVSGVDGDQRENLRDKEGKIEGDSTKGQDIGAVAETAGTGATVGAIAGGAKGAGIGAGVGAATGLGAVLLTRGPDMRLSRGSTLEMQLDRELAFTPMDVNFMGSAQPPRIPQPTAGESNTQRGYGWPSRTPLPRPF